jgi:ABC-type Fe3+-hydroxamate transport system substrate-binding protein
MNTHVVTDQMGRRLELPVCPQRIISLVPSQTELLADLGLSDKLCGITVFCIHPKEELRGIRRIGGTKQYRYDLIAELNPDLIIGNKEENEQEGIRYLWERYPVWMSDIYNLKDALEMIRSVGLITGKLRASEQIAHEIEMGFAQLKTNTPPVKAAYLIWKDPWMAAGSSTFINAMMQMAGYENVFQDYERYPVIELTDLAQKKPEIVFLSSEPYSFREHHLREFEELTGLRAMLADGELFSWYGSRLLKSPAYFSDLRRQQAGKFMQ